MGFAATMPATAQRIRGGLRDLLAPLIAGWPAVLLTASALALVLLHLGPGSRAFFAETLAPLCCPAADALELGWWAALYQHAAAFVLFLLLPLVVSRLALGARPSELGLGLGRWRLGFGAVVPLGLLLVALPGGLSAGGMPVFVQEYPLAAAAGASTERFVLYQLAYGFLYYAAYEAFFRGMLQFGLREHIGATGAILVQTAITTLLHIGKPPAEIWSALVAGFVFGSLALRLRSVWPLWLIHWGLGLLTDWSCASAGG
ncbi:MAG: CPBP family intramembrane metalloprotease [Candidatus Eisenbacteria bacterium]|nr:CPBP family intramembrane metalloprotease [Candidatus Eisenbacteria bacterium]